MCVSSQQGQLNRFDLLSRLEALDESVRKRSSVIAVAYRHWVEARSQIRAWYIAANKREPSNEDIGRYLYQWHDAHVPLEAIRQRIFANKVG